MQTEKELTRVPRIETNAAPNERELRKLLLDAEELFSAGLAFGDHSLVMRAAAIHNVKTFEAYKLDGIKSWSAYCDSIGLNRQDSYKYLDVAQKQIAVLDGVDSYEPFLFTKQHLAAILADTGKRFRSLRLRDAVARADRFDNSLQAMTGDELLKQRPALPAPSDSELLSKKTAASAAADFNVYMRDLCAERGWKWNRKEQRCEHEDGTPCTEEELGHITTPTAAVRVWEMVDQECNRMVMRMRETIMQEMKTFVRYRKAVPNEALSKKVAEVRESVHKQFEIMELMLDAMDRCDEKGVNEYRKYGLSE